MTSARRAGIDHQSRNVPLNQQPTSLAVSPDHEDHSAAQGRYQNGFCAQNHMSSRAQAEVPISLETLL